MVQDEARLAALFALAEQEKAVIEAAVAWYTGYAVTIPPALRAEAERGLMAAVLPLLELRQQAGQ